MTERVLISTPYGPIVAEVFADKAPVTVENFLHYVDEGLYSSATFYRAARPDNDERTPKIRIIQGGIDPMCGPGSLPPISHESTAVTGLSHVDGALSIVRWEPGTAASEFFIVVGNLPQLDFGGSRTLDGQGFAVFGKVVQGMDIVRQINASDTGASPAIEAMKNQLLIQPVAIRIERSRDFRRQA